MRETLVCQTCHAEVPLVIWGVHQESHLTAHKEPDHWLLNLGLVVVFVVATAIVLLR